MKTTPDTPDDQFSGIVPIRTDAENQSTRPDQRQARIEALTEELKHRREICQTIERFKSYDNFVASTLKLEGQITGLTESLRLAPPATATESEATN